MSAPTVLDAALALHDAGLCVLPAAEDGSKRPDVSTWRKYQRRRPTEDEVRGWFGDGRRTGLGVVCGRVSGGLEMTELEAEAVTAGALAQLSEDAEAAGEAQLWRRVTLDGWMVRSPSGGMHLMTRLADAEVPGNTKLAATPEHRTLAETRGEGGGFVPAPSHGSVHPGSGAWQTLAGGPYTLPTITADERARLHALVQLLDQRPMPAPVAAPASPFTPLARGVGDGISPGDDFAKQTEWVQILEPVGWRRVSTRGEVAAWRRPGKSTGISATTGYGAGDWLYVF